ncbi:hypothetical protein GCM10009609_10690 [Pseudonocardia aurantiaca]|uniref:Uncharacterized protein n=1 Tax=Pseudonocardia aurantiaca TaxID=75290 RepID=A0ABW4FCP9_9PSEU
MTAPEHLTAAEAELAALPDDGYGRMIWGGITRLRAELAGP